MELKYFLNILFKKLWIILLLSFIAAAAVAVITFFFIEPQYEASTTIYVTRNNNNASTPIAYDDILVSQQLIKDYSELIKSRAVTKMVLEQLNITGMSSRDLARKVTVNLKNETRLFEIKVTDPDPIRAKILADQLSNVFIEKIKNLMMVERLDIIDSAEIPEKPVKPNYFLNTMIAFVISLFISLGIVFTIEYLDDTIRSDEDVERYLELTVLGIIPVTEIK